MTDIGKWYEYTSNNCRVRLNKKASFGLRTTDNR